MRWDWRIWCPSACLFLAAAGAFNCNKTAGVNSNKANLLVVHVAPSRPALAVGDTTTDTKKHKFTSFLESFITYGSATGTVPDGTHPYQYQAKYYEVGVGVKPIQVVTTATSVLSRGSTTFNYGRNYTMFLFDDSIPNRDTISTFFLPDNIVTSVDTFAYLRVLNFCPGNTYYNIQIRGVRPDYAITGAANDTINSGFLNFVGNSETISQYAFKRVHSGSYEVLIDTAYNRLTGKYVDSIKVFTDSLFLLRDKSYTAFVQGYLDSTGAKQLQLRVIQHN